MNRFVFWVLGILCIAVEVWGLVIDNWDVHYLGAFAALGVIAVDRLLLRADRCQEFAEAGEEL